MIGRITNKVETLGGVTSVFGYSYDAGGRLAQVWQNGSLTANYTYDPNGNRLSRNSETAAYDAQDRIASYNGATFAWSPDGTRAGRTAGGQTTSYTYDVRGGLTAVDLPGGYRIDYTIDPAGHRSGKRVNGVLERGWLTAGGRIVAEVDSNSALKSLFVYAADSATPSFMLQGTNSYRIFSDERGSARLVVNCADGSIAQELAYDEFGRVLADTNPGFQPFGFAGGLYDPDTSLVRFGLRDYDAETGQWTARDPLGLAGGPSDTHPGFPIFGFAGGTYTSDTSLARFLAAADATRSVQSAALGPVPTPPGSARWTGSNPIRGGGFSAYAYVGNDPVNSTDVMGTGPSKDEDNQIKNPNADTLKALYSDPTFNTLEQYQQTYKMGEKGLIEIGVTAIVAPVQAEMIGIEHIPGGIITEEVIKKKKIEPALCKCVEHVYGGGGE